MLRRLAAVALLALAAARLDAQAPATADQDAVRAVVQRYLHGLKFNDTTSFHEAFWPQAKLFYVNRQGQIGEWTQASWYKGFAASAGKEEQGELKIAAVDVTKDIASVKVVEEYATSRYIDYLSLLKVQGRWWIVNKVYTEERR